MGPEAVVSVEVENGASVALQFCLLLGTVSKIDPAHPVNEPLAYNILTYPTKFLLRSKCSTQARFTRLMAVV